MNLIFKKATSYTECRHKEEDIILIEKEKFCTDCGSKLDPYGYKIVEPAILHKGIEKFVKLV